TYQPGETIQGKWYLVNNTQKNLAAVNLYADWYDDAGALLQHQVWLIQQNTGQAQFKIPADYSGKFLRVVPYTLGAKNKNRVMPEQVIFIRPDALFSSAPKTKENPTPDLRIDTTGKILRVQLSLPKNANITDTVYLQRWRNGAIQASQTIVVKDDAESEWDFDRAFLPGTEEFRLVNNRGEYLHHVSLKPLPAKTLAPLNIDFKQKSFAPKGRNEWILTANNNEWMHLSVSVVDAATHVPIPTNLSTHQVAWENQPQFVVTQPDAFIQVKGRVQGNDVLPEKLKLTASVFSAGRLPQIESFPVGADGSFLFPGIYAEDSAILSVQLDYPGRGKKNFELQFAQLGQFAEAPRFHDQWSFSRPQLTLPAGTKKPLPFAKTDENEVVVFSKVKSDAQLMEEKYTHGLFRGGDAVAIDLLKKETQSFRSVFHYLQGKVPGLQIFFVNADPGSGGGAGAVPSSPSAGGMSTPARQAVSATGASPRSVPGEGDLVGGTPVLQWRAQEPVQIFLNEVPTTAGTLMTIPMTELAYVKAFRPPFMGAALGAPGGAIAVYTRVGDEKDPFYESHRLTSFKLKGFNAVQPYVQPDYQLAKNRALPDNRLSLFWDPQVVLTAQKPSQRLVFYNNDSSRKFKLVIEGIRQDGALIRLEKEIE
ncbi:MAG: hypothetical protein EAZ62_02415, partial [Sphingobacteriia bacterium]